MRFAIVCPPVEQERIRGWWETPFVVVAMPTGGLPAGVALSVLIIIIVALP
jgi:hypothetical protein